MEVVKLVLASLLVAAAAISLAAAGLAPAARPIEDVTGSALKNGFYGTLYRGPISPVCRIGQPCEAPAPNVTLIFARPGAAAIRVKTGQDGKYRVLMPAAVYSVDTDARGPTKGKAPFPARVKVRLGHVDKLDFRIDTGIR